MTARMMKTKSLRIPQKRVDDWMELEPGSGASACGGRGLRVRVLGVEREAGSSSESDDAVDRPGVQRARVQDGQREELQPEEEPRLEGWPTADEREPRGGAPASCEPPPEGTEGDWVNLGAILGFWGCIRAWAGGETEIGPDWRGSSAGDRIRVKFFDRYKLQWARPDRSELN